jgi:hypothetical protein
MIAPTISTIIPIISKVTTTPMSIAYVLPRPPHTKATCAPRDRHVADDAAQQHRFDPVGVHKLGRTSQNVRFAGKTEFTHPTRSSG